MRRRTTNLISEDISGGTGDAGVLIVEALAQTGAVAILSMEENRGKTAYFAEINRARFKKKGGAGRCADPDDGDHPAERTDRHRQCDGVCARGGCLHGGALTFAIGSKEE